MCSFSTVSVNRLYSYPVHILYDLLIKKVVIFDDSGLFPTRQYDFSQILYILIEFENIIKIFITPNSYCRG